MANDFLSDADIGVGAPSKQPSAPIDEAARDQSYLSDEDIGFGSTGAPSASSSDWAGSVAAGLRGVRQGLPFGQDIGAAANSLPRALGHAVAPSLVEEGPSFSEEKRHQIERDKQLSEAHPLSYGAGEAAGIIGSLPAFEVLAPADAAVAARLAPKIGETAAKAIGTGVTGSGIGAVQGLGEGTTLDERLHAAKTGALAGAALGTALPLVGKGIGAGAGKVSQAAKEVFGDAGENAAKKIKDLTANDIARGHKSLTPEEVEAARARGQEVLPIDLGGPELQREARRAANVSPEADSAFSKVLGDRYADQQQRYTDFLKRMASSDLDAAGQLDAMRSAAREINAPAYEKAYAVGANGVWNPELYNLFNSPTIKKSVPEAIEKLQNKAILEGRDPIANPFVKDKAGNYYLPEGYKPSLEMWDNIKRSLDDKIGMLDRKGKFDQSRDVKAIRDRLLSHLDKAVPEFKVARSSAAQAFGEENAYEAGLKFMTERNSLGASESRQALSKMGDKERQMFADGVIQDLRHRISNNGTSRDISKLFDNKLTKEKLADALGADRASELEAFSRVEELMAASHQAIQRNSTTAKQLQDVGGRRHGAHMMLTAMGAFTHGLPGIAEGIAAGIADNLYLKFAGELGKKKAAAVAQKLLSREPESVKEAVAEIAANPAAMSKLRNISRSLTSIGSSAISRSSAPAYAEARAARAGGGKIGSRDYPAKPLSRMERALARAQKAISEDTMALMDVPDESVANALRLAKG
jgi:hypothetical protein